MLAVGLITEADMSEIIPRSTIGLGYLLALGVTFFNLAACSYSARVISLRGLFGSTSGSLVGAGEASLLAF
jgi:hypothetical protein